MPEGQLDGAKSNVPSMRGIFDCDNAYRTPTQADYERVFTTGLVVLDANVLLNLYRSNERTRNDTLVVLERLRERLWIPYQVLTEFWRNRDLPSVRGHHRSKAREAVSALDKVSRSINDALDRWMKDVHLNSEEEIRQQINDKRESLAEILEQLKKTIKEQADKDALEGVTATHTDPVLARLEPLLRGRIGEPLPPEDFRDAVQEAQRRGTQKVPPGYADFESKPAEQASGDYILWIQLLKEAALRQGDVLLVTGDVKDDWWVQGDGRIPARPRTELTVEMRTRTPGLFLMLTPSQLLSTATKIFSLQVDERSVSDLATTEKKKNLRSSFFSTDLFTALTTRLAEAHAIAKEATKPANKQQFYGSVVSGYAREEICDEIISRGGSILRLSGTEYPIFDGCLIIPHRYGKAPEPHIGAVRRISTSNRVAHILNKYRNDESSFTVDSNPQDMQFTSFDRANVLAYSSSFSDGITSAYWMTMRLGEEVPVVVDSLLVLEP
ncbi:PIN-like domain-containing protein [Streptomyces longwoodensis]|uniref:PIN-like domain-containing protein n=1 Tax=Streptomyces longwoodensis TaxID=68231 RepID=UPI0033C23CAD